MQRKPFSAPPSLDLSKIVIQSPDASQLIDTSSLQIPSISFDPADVPDIESPFLNPILNIASDAEKLGINIPDLGSGGSGGLSEAAVLVLINGAITALNISQYSTITYVDDAIAAAIAGFSTTLDGLSDVTLTGPIPAGHYLRYNGTVWTNAQIDYADITGTPGSGAFVDLTSAQSIGGAKDFTGFLSVDGLEVWHPGNDGAGSGLDADLLDGQEGAWYADIVSRLGYTPLPTGSYTAADVLSKLLTVDGAGSGIDADTLDGIDSTSFVLTSAYTAADVLSKLLTVDGIGSGIDADLLDGQNSSYYLTAGTYTAADVLAKLLTVDGSGSGIDADLLDGQNSSYYATAGSLGSYLPLAGGILSGGLTATSFTAVADAVSRFGSGSDTPGMSGTLPMIYINGAFSTGIAVKRVGSYPEVGMQSGATAVIGTFSNHDLNLWANSVLQATITTGGFLVMNSNTPGFVFNDLNSGTNEKYWRWSTSGAVLSLDLCNDAGSGLNNFMSFTRTAGVATSVSAGGSWNLRATGQPLKIGTDSAVSTNRAAVRFADGGYGAPAGFNVDSDGDKIILMRSAALNYDATIGVGSASDMWFKSQGGSGFAGLFRWYIGGTVTQMAELSTVGFNVGNGAHTAAIGFLLRGGNSGAGGGGNLNIQNGGTAIFALGNYSSIYGGAYDARPVIYTASGVAPLINGNTMWHSGNDGAGSGLDADLLDGISSAAFMQQSLDITAAAISFTGNGGNSGISPKDYSIYQEAGGWSHPYPDLEISYHTGIKIGASSSYGGIRMYNNSALQRSLGSGTLCFSVGDGDTNVRVYNSLIWASYGSSSWEQSNRMIIQPVNNSLQILNMAGSAYAGLVCDNLYAYNNVVAYSDISLKENIQNMIGASEKLRALRPVSYDRIGDENKRSHLGFIAQEVQLVTPEFIEVEHTSGLLALDYGKLTSVLTAGWQDHDARILELESKIAELLEFIKKKI